MAKGITVTIGTNCEHKRDNGLGLYCMMGTRKLKKLQKNGKDVVICLDCDEPGKPAITITKRKDNEEKGA